MRQWILAGALVAAGCGHAHEAEVVSSYEPRATIGQTLTSISVSPTSAKP